MDKQRTEQAGLLKAITDGGPGKGRMVSQQACQPESLLK